MPKVTQREQYNRHLFLRMLSRDGVTVFAQLSPTDQWKIHAFYRPDEELSPEEFKAHLIQVKLERPELAHVVGKLFFRMQDHFIETENWRRLAALAKPALQDRPRRRGTHGKIVVQGIVRPQPDLGKLVAAVREMARYEAQQAAASPSQNHLDDLS